MALKAILEGQTLAEVCRQQKIRRHALTDWLDSYLHFTTVHFLKVT
ncbi:MAG: hypothetical protein NTV00_00400 [Methylococcales bacterium]|nr:hypothetical protein [Methylococcales bacterium]